jgi:hypothetical protein
MSGINTGILTNAYPLSAERIKELEKQVLENKTTFAYLDENGELCFSMPWGVDGIKDLAWHNAYELSSEETGLTKKLYRKTGLKTYSLAGVFQKQNINDSWSGGAATKRAPGLYETGAIALFDEGKDDEAAAMLKTSWADLIANGDIIVEDGVVSAGYTLPDNLLEKNEYGFYFDAPYTFEDSGASCSIVFHEDGSVDMYVDGELDNSAPAGSALYFEKGEAEEELGASGGIEFMGYFYVFSDRVLVPESGSDGMPVLVLGEPAKLEGDLILPNTSEIAALAEVAFSGQIYMTGIALSDGLSSIPHAAFAGCLSLTSITLPSGITNIQSFAFCNCTSLAYVLIPASLEYFAGGYLFDGCINIQSLNFAGTLSQWNAIDYRTYADWIGYSSIGRVQCSDGNYSFK